MQTVHQLLEHYHRMNDLAVQAKIDIINLEVHRWIEEARNNQEPCDTVTELLTAEATIRENLTKIKDLYVDLRTSLLSKVDETDADFYARSSDLYKETLLYPAEYVLGREEQNLIHHGQTWQTFCDRVKMYVSWQHPAVELRPGTGRLTRHLVACDPLYLVDTSDQLLQPAKEAFTSEYKQRLRLYTVNETNKLILSALPQGQFGLVVAHDFFQYHPIEQTERYIREVFDLLRPGGHFVFTFNDCDLPNGVDLATRMFYCYTPGRKIQALLEQYGYEIVARYNLNLNTAWIEARKPGTLSSIRGSQTLGKVVNI